jgi:uncharacterized protein
VNGPASIAPELWASLAGEARRRAEGREPAHDFFHVERVVSAGRAIARAERADEGVVAVAALLHELFSYPKGDPRSPESGDVCAEHARALLVERAATPAMVARVCEAIRDHAFSKGVVPGALEAKVLQDADRLDALGAIGLARMWATCADMKRPLYAPDDPFCDARAPDDKAWGLDHVYKKLLRVPERLHTKTARALAERRVAFMRAYLGELRAEIAEGDGR